jgi:hypothetical protein
LISQFTFSKKKDILGAMVKHQARGSDQLFIETKLGIVTRSGEWFHTNSENIQQYAPGLLEKVPLDLLIKDARAWVRSADSLALTLVLGLLLYVNPWLATVGTIAFHWVWYNYKSAIANRWFGSLFAVMNTDAFQVLMALVVLSLFGMWGNYLALAIGIVFFFVFRLGLLNKLWDRLTSNKKLSLNDRMLKMLIVKYAQHENVAPAGVEQMERELQEAALRMKNKRN